MPRGRSEKSIEAEKLYHSKQKLVDIARTLGVPEGTVRRWKSDQDWDKKKAPPPKKKQSERSESNPNARKQNARKKGAPPGNQNAVGNTGGAPPGNQNSVKHGIYSQVFWDVLDENEAKLINDMPTDEEQHLIDEIRLLTVRERRLMQKIQELSGAPRNMLINEVHRYEDKREFESEEDKELYQTRQRAKINDDKLLPGRSVKISTSTINSSDLLLRAHAELTRVQSQKTRCVEALSKIRQSKEGGKGNSMAEEWIAALIGGDIEDE